MRHKNQKKHALSEQSLNALKKNCTHIAVRKENIARDPGGRRWGDYVEFAGRNGSKTVVLPIDDVRQMKWRKQRFGVRPLNLLDNELDSEMLLKEIRKKVESAGLYVVDSSITDSGFTPKGDDGSTKSKPLPPEEGESTELKPSPHEEEGDPNPPKNAFSDEMNVDDGQGDAK